MYEVIDSSRASYMYVSYYIHRRIQLEGLLFDALSVRQVSFGRLTLL